MVTKPCLLIHVNGILNSTLPRFSQTLKHVLRLLSGALLLMNRTPVLALPRRSSGGLAAVVGQVAVDGEESEQASAYSESGTDPENG